jgi:shikimate kinase
LTQPQNIILVGFMASGKSHVGRVLSQKLGWPLRDADDEIVKRKGSPIHRIFEEEGEAVFRALERCVIADWCNGTGTIIAAGGGAFIDPENRRLMLEKGTVFCLTAQPQTIYSRVSKGNNSSAEVRPLLAGANPLERIESLLAQRSDAYAQAHYIIETDLLTPEQVAEQILRLCSLTNEVQIPGPSEEDG